MTDKAKSPILRFVFLMGGFLFTFLAILGFLLPLLPTTPFLLAASACFFKSSDRFYRFIMENRWFGHYLQNYQAGLGIPLKVKLMALSFMWTSTLISAFIFAPWLWLKLLLIGISLAITIHLWMVKTKKNETN